MSGGHELEGAVAAIVAAGDHPPANAERTIDELLDALERGEVRAAERDRDGAWHAVAWVKQGILLAFRLGDVVDMSPIEGSPFQFYDKHTLPTQDIPLENGVRIVPGGSTVRRGAHLARGRGVHAADVHRTPARGSAPARWWIRTRSWDRARRSASACT